MSDGMESLRNNELMRGLIERVFDFDREVDESEREIFSIPSRMELMFNYMDLSFQLFPSSSDETFKIIAKNLNELQRYYDRKSCLNLGHSDKIIDIFRYCIRKDNFLSKYLDKNTESLDNSKSNLRGIAQTN